MNIPQNRFGVSSTLVTMSSKAAESDLNETLLSLDAVATVKVLGHALVHDVDQQLHPQRPCRNG